MAQSNESVTIRFDPATRQFDIDPETVVLDGPGRIRLGKAPANATWDLADVTIQDGDGQFVVESKSGQQIVIRDEFLQAGEFCYTVTVMDDKGTAHVSPDPHIRNVNPGTL